MADFKVDGRMKVKSLKANFKKAFGCTLRVYTTTTCKTPLMTMRLWHQSRRQVQKAVRL